MADEKKLSDMYRTQTLREWPAHLVIGFEGPDGMIVYTKEQDLKCATNPGHAAAVCNPHGNTPAYVLDKTGKGGPSQNNIDDVDRSLRIINPVQRMPQAQGKSIVCVFKHVNSTGVEVDDDPLKAFSRAWDSNVSAAYGSTVTFSVPVTGELLREAYKHIKSRDPASFIDNLVAPGFTDDAREYIGKKEAIRVFKYDPERLAQIDPFKKGRPELKPLIDGRYLVYEPYVEVIRSAEDLKVKTTRQPLETEVRDMIFAWYVCAHTRSNAVVFAKDFGTVAVGTGKQERIAAIKDAIQNAEEKAAARGEDPAKCLEGAVMASDGFIPNTDNIPPLKERGVKAIIHPGGSKVADDAVIAACNDAGISIVFTEWRCFSHH